jgi:quinol monooxygenase YgiN
MQQLADAAAQHPGCLQSYVMRPHDESGEIARLAIYADEDSAESTASSQHMLALRSQMHLLCEPGHVERAFFTISDGVSAPAQSG